ncbi:MAG: ABC transporter ATP-binding protein [Acidimicrobiia bacterium]|nr:ABC transporter ATP-binding protein [Acidimicrobiia bacterium]
MTLLQVEDLTITYRSDPPVYAVDGVSFSLETGRATALIGESGSGKSTVARSLLGLVDGADIGGRIVFDGDEVQGLEAARWRDYRWGRIGLVFQSATALNPVLRIGLQLTEPLVEGDGLSAAAAEARARAVIDLVGLEADVYEQHPAELSGGRRRLALLAIALVRDPELLVLDEPTAGLDPVTRAEVLALLQRLRNDRSLLLLTHDIDALDGLVDHVGVLYRGRLIESGKVDDVLTRPRHPYTWGLLNAHPRLGNVKDLRGIRGRPPDNTEPITGCGFVERCTQAVDACRTDDVTLQPLTPDASTNGTDDGRQLACLRGGLVPVLQGRGLRKVYTTGPALNRRQVVAVDDVDVEVRHGEVLGIVGSNGAGKSTLGQLLLRLVDADSGIVEFDGGDLLSMKGDRLKAARRRLQMLFQDPYEALSPRLRVGQCVIEPLEIQGIGTAAERSAAASEALDSVRLPTTPGFLDRHTHELSGGQLQRVALARALVLDPVLLVADEPFEGLDPSEQAKMIQLLKSLQVERGMSMVLVSHDMAVTLRTADRIVVIHEGRIVEEAAGRDLLRAPQHPATRRLLAAAGAEVSSVSIPANH